MEGTMQKWEGQQTVGEEVVSRGEWTHMHISTTNNGIEGSASFYTNEVSIGVKEGIHHQYGDIGKNNNLLPAPEPPILQSATSSSTVTTQNAPVGIVIENKEEVQELYLQKIFIMPPSHGFYCPNCNACIGKVLVYKRQEEIDPPEVEPPEVEPPDNHDRIRCSACFQFLIRTGTVVDISELPAVLKSIVYGGMTELLASLSVVTSAASAGATTLNIVALAIANLIGGLFVLGHNLKELKAEKPRGEDSEADAPVDRYYELLGQRENFFLHAFVAFLSFLIFGLMPPIVYGFSFHESDDMDLKLAAVSGASLLCITLLAIAKAYIQRPNDYATYFKTVLYYVSTGALASVLTYVAGALIKRLVEKLGWFESRSNFGFSHPEMSTIEKHGWGSY